MKKLISTLLCLLSTTVAFSASYLIHNEKEFNDIRSQIKPGDQVLIANGTYAPWGLEINQQITIQAETTGKVIFTGDVTKPIFKLTGSYTVLKGITFAGCTMQKGGVLVELSGVKYCRLTECMFNKNVTKSQFTPAVVVSGKGEYNRVDHCTFAENVDNQELQVKVTKEVTPQYTLIDHNTFKDKNKVSWKNSNGGECVQIGQDPILLGAIPAQTIVRENHFIRCNGEAEVISNKSSNNSYIKNQFEDCDGELVMRGGHDCVIDSNIIKGGNSGIRVNGSGHKIMHNEISNVKTGIRLMYGMASGKTETGFYIAASGCTIKYNHISKANTGILIGDSKNADWTNKFDTTRYPSRVMQDVAPFDNTLADNVFTDIKTNVVNQ